MKKDNDSLSDESIKSEEGKTAPGSNELAVNSIKEYMENKYNERRVATETRKELAQILHSVERDSLSGEKFINELLQNADDACEQANIDNGCIRITLLKDFIIFTHNGKPFDEKDVKAISSCASPERDKTKNLNQIGNKGIGFKAVFSVSPYVLIRSNSYSFCFDKLHNLWQDNPKEWPWEVTPLWVEEEALPEEVKPYLKDDQMVHFVLKLEEKLQLEVQQSLSELTSNMTVMPFLRRIKSIQFIDEQKKTKQHAEMVYVNEVVKNKVELYQEMINQNVTSQWYVYLNSRAISEVIQQEAKQQEELAIKFKNMDRMPISMAIRVVNNRIEMQGTTRVYCYLPTEISWQLPFAFSSEFFLDTGRAHIQSDGFAKKWNNLIIKAMFRFQFYFMQHLALDETSELWKEVIKLIVHPNAIEWGKFIDIKPDCIARFDTAINTIPFLKNMTLSRVMLLNEIKYDEYDFVKAFGDYQLKESCIHPDVAEISKLKAYNLQTFDVKAIIAKLREVEFQESIKNKDKNIEIIEFVFLLYEKLLKNNKREDAQTLVACCKSTPLFVNRRGQLVKPSEIFFSTQEFEFLYEKFDFISLVQEEIEKNYEHLKKWLQTLGVLTLSLTNIISTVNKHPDKLVEFWKTFFNKDHRRTELKKTDFEALKKLNLKTKHGTFIAAEQCYLPDALSPTANLEEVIPEYHFVHPEYWEDVANKPEIKSYFTQMGVAETIYEKNLEEIIKAANQNESVLIVATKAIFNAFCAKNISSEIIENSAIKLKLLANDGKYYLPYQLYLPDILNKKYKLQALNLGLPILAKEYEQIFAGGEEHIVNRFLRVLGVLSTPKVKVLNNKTVNELSAYPFASEYCNTCLIRYTDNRVDSYIDISSIDKILTTPFFWKMLSSNWEVIENGAKKGATDKWWHPYPLSMSNIEFLVSKAIQHHYPNKSANELFSPLMKRKLGENTGGLLFADVVSDLNEEQLQYFGFKDSLSIDDSIGLLQEISKKETIHDFGPVAFIYCQILKYLSTYHYAALVIPTEKRANLKLLNQMDTFINCSEAFAMIDEESNIQSSQFLLKKPSQMNIEDFKKLCAYFQIETFTKNELMVDAPPAEEGSNLKFSIEQRVSILLLFESKANDTPFLEYVKKNYQDLLQKITQLNIVRAEYVKLSFKEVYSEEVECFEHKPTTTIYYHHSENTLVMSQLYELVYNYLELKIALNDFVRILTSEKQVLIKKYQFLTKEKLEKIDAALIEFKQQHLESPRNLDDEEHSDSIASSRNMPILDQAEAAYQADFDGQQQLGKSMVEQNTEQQAISSNNTFTTYAPGKRTIGDNSELAKRQKTTDPKHDEQPHVSKKPSPEASQPHDGFDGHSTNQSVPNQYEKSSSQRPVIFPSNSGHLLSEEERKRIGRLGEKYVYERLQTNYRQKYLNCTFTETDTGFKLEGEGLVGKNKTHGPIKLEVTWHNKGLDDMEDWGGPKDFTIIKNRSEKVVEVKATHSATNSKFHVSTDERKVMEDYQNRYRIFRVYNVYNEESRSLKKIKNPAEKIQSGEIKISSYEMEF